MAGRARCRCIPEDPTTGPMAQLARPFGACPVRQNGAAQASAVAALRLAIDVFLRLLAPVIPFATEEVWRWTHDGSIHTAAWPTVDEIPVSGPTSGLLDLCGVALIGIRGAKTEAKASQKTPVTRAVVTGPALLAEAKDDLAAVGRIENLELVDGTEVAVQSIELGELPE